MYLNYNLGFFSIILGFWELPFLIFTNFNICNVFECEKVDWEREELTTVLITNLKCDKLITKII
jgi:hypothetical protein